MSWGAKNKGNYYERKSAEYWRGAFGLGRDDIRRTPMSGAFAGYPADLLIKEDCVLSDFVIDVKSEQGLIAKKGLMYYKKNKDNGRGKMSFLEMYIKHYGDSPLILISREDFAKILTKAERAGRRPMMFSTDKEIK